MEFRFSQICCGGGDWEIIGRFVAAHCDTNTVGLFLLGSDFADDVELGDLAVLGNLVSTNEEAHVCYLDISYSLEQLAYLIEHGPGSFLFLLPLNQVYVLLVFASLWADGRVNYLWLGANFDCVTICVHPVLSCFVHHCVGWCGVWNLSG